MEEEIQLINENAKKEKIKKFFINNSKLIIISVLIVVLSIIFFFGLQELKLRKQIKIAERYNKIITSFQSIKNTEEVKKELVEIINSKHPTYSPLALYFILEEEIYDENTEINDFFDKIIDISSMDNEIKNLNIYKKAVFNSEFVEEQKLIEILRPILNSNSIWKSHSLLLLADYFYFKNNKEEAKKLLNEIIINKNSNQEIKIEAQKKLTRDFSE